MYIPTRVPLRAVRTVINTHQGVSQGGVSSLLVYLRVVSLRVAYLTVGVPQGVVIPAVVHPGCGLFPLFPGEERVQKRHRNPLQRGGVYKESRNCYHPFHCWVMKRQQH